MVYLLGQLLKHLVLAVPDWWCVPGSQGTNLSKITAQVNTITKRERRGVT